MRAANLTSDASASVLGLGFSLKQISILGLWNLWRFDYDLIGAWHDDCRARTAKLVPFPRVSCPSITERSQLHTYTLLEREVNSMNSDERQPPAATRQKRKASHKGPWKLTE